VKSKKTKPKKLPKKFKGFMSEDVKLDAPVSETLVVKKDNDGRIEIRAEAGSAGRLEIYMRHPVLAEVIEKMAMGNFPKDQFDEVYAPCLLEFPDPKAKEQKKVVSRPAIYTTTKHFVGGTDFDFSAPPRGVLIANPEALRKGFSLFINLKAPVPTDVLRRWGNQWRDGCSDIITASRPFVMQWVMTEKPLSKL